MKDVFIHFIDYIITEIELFENKVLRSKFENSNFFVYEIMIPKLNEFKSLFEASGLLWILFTNSLVVIFL